MPVNPGPEEQEHKEVQSQFTSNLQRQLYLQPRSNTSVRAPKNALRAASSSTSTAAKQLPQLERSFVVQKTQQLHQSLKAAQGPVFKNTVPCSPKAELPPLKAREKGQGAAPAPPLRGALVKQAPDVGHSAEGYGGRTQFAAGGSEVVPVHQTAAQALGPAADLAYVKLIYTLREYPNTEDFVYLKRMDRNPSDYDPYALEVIPFAVLNQEDFYTMTVRGITHYVDGLAVDFASLDQWERELQLYGSLKKLQIFRLYKLWKAFKVWKKAVNRAKFSHARASLEKNLFLLSPVFQTPIQRSHGLCHALSIMRLHALEDKRVYTLQEFVEQQEQHSRRVEAALVEFSSHMLDTVRDACHADLQHLEERLKDFNKKQDNPAEASPTATTTTKKVEPAHSFHHQSAMARVEASREQEQNESDFAFTIAAARRSEQRRLLNYVRMSDYMVCDTLHTVLVETVREIYEAVRYQPASAAAVSAHSAVDVGGNNKQASVEKPMSGTAPEPGAEQAMGLAVHSSVFGTSSSDGHDDAAKKAVTAVKQLLQSKQAGPASRALFEIELLLNEVTIDLQLEPASEEYQQAMAEVLQGYVASLCTVNRLYGKSELLDLVMGNAAKEVEPGTDLQELVVHDDFETLVSRFLRNTLETKHVQSSLQHAFDVCQRHVEEYFQYRDMVLADHSLDVAALGPAFKCKKAYSRDNSSSNGLAAPVDPAVSTDEQGTADSAHVVQQAPAEPHVTLATFKQLMDMLAQQKDSMMAIPDFQDVSIIRINCVRLKDALVPAPTTTLGTLHEMLPTLAAELFQGFMAEVQEANSSLQARSSSVEEYVENIQFLQEVRANEKLLDMRCNEIHDLYSLIDMYGIPVTAMDRAAYTSLDTTYNNLKTLMEDVESSKEEHISKYNFSLDAGMESIATELKEIRAQAAHEMVLSQDAAREKVVAYLSNLQDEVSKLNAEAERINKYQRLFKLNETTCEALGDTAEDVGLKLALWQGSAEMEELSSTWRATQFENLDLATMEEAIARLHKSCTRMERGLQPNKVVPKFRVAIDIFRNLLPVVQALRNTSLKERHWTKVFDAVGEILDRGPNFTLQALLDVHVVIYKDALLNISTEASQEAALEELLAKMQGRWATMEFVLVPYKELKDIFILGGIEDIQVALEDSQVTMSTILASRFVAGIRPEVEKVERQLALFSETLEEWVAAQKAWMYLEPIFSAPDIQRQLPVEAKGFFAVDKQLRDIMRRTKDRPNALQAGTVPGMLEVFQNANQTLEKIQKNLEDYLETKRMAFPRFYFLSNDELLEILAQTKNVQAVQPHMGKCFDGIRRLDFGDDPKSIDIFAMISGEKERVSLGKNLKARGNVEKWLADVESQMISSLRKLARAGYASYVEEDREDWVQHQPAQLAIVVSQVYWCAGVEAALNAKEPATTMSKFLQVNIRQLAGLTQLVRGELTSLARRALAALITIDVHARDIVFDLAKHGTHDVSDFEWQMQLRYYVESDDVTVRQVNASFQYAFEYLGAQPRLVVTPMTDRCYLTLTGALHLKLGGAPAGPAGTGKTETTKDLGKALGVNCVVFNCGENLDYKFMGKFFSGLVQCGAWACFDEFNRIDIEVLSVVAQQLLTVQNALKGGLTSFNFEGRQIRLVPTCGVFITMNPGYAGRTELPDNLKDLFRPMAMMIPDYALVAEVMLFSEGFEDSKNLSSKMVKLYKLASEQLSQQDHYDFGMRAVKSVLVMAGFLKRANPSLSEDVVLIQAMRDSNVPKFLDDDVELFQNIISDLFPGIVIPDQDHGELEQAICAALQTAGLQDPQPYVTKVLQLYGTMDVRFGVMLVGSTGGGKTQCYRTLQAALTKLRSHVHHPNQAFQVTHTYTFNPKAIRMGELYGEYNVLTNEWTDGLGSMLIRSAVSDTSLDKKWIIFDGPVDAIWIENMNTVLDDTCTLCLPNGERIKLNPLTMRMLFEVKDLAVASPATVSRCGMVYLALEVLGWRPLVRTWCNISLPQVVVNNCKEIDVQPTAGVMSDGRPGIGVLQMMGTAVLPGLDTDQRALIWALFDAHVDAGLAWLANQGKEYIPTVHNNRTASLCSLMQSMLRPSHGFHLDKKPEDVLLAIRKAFAFSYVWALGGNLQHSQHDEWNGFAREQLAPVANFPGSGLVFDYYLDGARSFPPEFHNWSELVQPFTYHKDVPYFQMLVPTVDTTRFSFLLELCLDVSRSVLFTGVTGVGKSVVTVAALESLHERKGVVPVTINFSAQTQSLDTQLLIESKLEKKRKTRFGPPAGKKLVFFIDDVNMPAREKYGAQPPIELLRQFQDLKGFYDRKKLWWKEVEDTTLCAACAPPGGGRQEMTSRFVRHFTLLCVPPPSTQATRTILTAILGGFLIDFSTDFRSLQKPLVDASVEAYTRISEELLPTPAKSHYTFNLRDLSKVFQGVVMAAPGSCPSKDAMLRLWVHESCRVFHDRLICAEDKEYFKRMLAELMSKHSLGATYDDMFVSRHIIWGDFLKMGLEQVERKYEEVPGSEKLVQVLEDYLDEYNLNATNTLNLVFFMDAVEHITRIARILRQPRGNAMLVGVGGSGKSSLTRFATFLGGFKIFGIELTRGYGNNEFREDLKKLYRAAGINGEPVVFLFSDSQIVSESFLEDIHNMLNSGNVPGMLAPDEKDRVCTDIRDWVIARGVNPTKDACYNAFIERARDNLHIVLAMSPVGEAFRARCRQFPSLINCCTIDWFSQWPEDALLSVSRKFLAGTDLGSEQVRDAVASMCVSIHTSVAVASDRFFSELRRRYYTTPKSYLDLIQLYLQLLKERREANTAAQERLENGLHKLQETNMLVEQMQQDLAELQPVLQSKAAATAELLKKVAADQEEAEVVKRTVAAEEREVKAMAREIQMVADEAKADLAEAMPALQAAIDSLKALNKNDIVEIKSFPKPPPLVQMTMEAVCILKQEKPDWDSAKRLLSDSNFMRSLEEFDKDNISDAVIKRLKKYIDDPNYNPDSVGKQSRAAMSLCMWSRAMDVYHRVAKVVEPKRLKLRKAEDALAGANRKLNEKQIALKEVELRVAALKQHLDHAQQEQKSLADQADITRKRLERAGKLTSALADEGVRWQDTANNIQQSTSLLVGDVFLSAACIAYYGAFTGSYRQELVGSWIAECKQRSIPVSSDCSLRDTLASPVEVRDWKICGLPTDDVSVDNGILVARGKRWPLMIDPQGQANTWVKAMEQRNGLRVLKSTDNAFLRTLESCIRTGSPVLLEDVGESLDPALEPVLQKGVFSQGGRLLIHLGDSDIDYDTNFKLYIATKLSNPHFLPEVCIKVTIINFTVTMKGLENQLLGEVVRRERPDLEEARDRLVLSISADKKQLAELEDKILKLLKESQGNILDDEQLINTLNHSKLTSSVITNRVSEAETTEQSINQAREHYRSAATRGSILYFVVADLSLISPMYQFSLPYFTRMFSYCIEKSEHSDHVPTRLSILSNSITRVVFNNVSRGLFEQHKMLFAFLTATSILRHPSSGEISPLEWGYLVRGRAGLMPPDARIRPAWMNEHAWAAARHAEATVPCLSGLLDSLLVGPDASAWAAWAASDDPHCQPLPGPWQERLGQGVGRLLLLKTFREEKLLSGCSQFVSTKLGPEFIEANPWTLDDVFPDTSSCTPVIFILSTGADPTPLLQRFAEKKGWVLGERLHMISLGQGQGPIAEMLIAQAAKAGDWVCLQNCHLASSWMLRLQEKVDELAKSNAAGGDMVHPDFRLWLTSMPSHVFPVAVLQNGIKLTNEPPKGIKANVARTYNGLSQAFLDSCPAKPQAWRKLLFALSFFHAVVQERRKFGPLGFNIQYEFNSSDLECSMMTLRMFLSEQEVIPWPALEYVIGQINYGGRVTDDLDRRCLMSILRQYMAPRVLDDTRHITSGSDAYFIPPDGPLEAYCEYLRGLPATEEPEVFGMHQNANISFQLQETRKLIDTVLSIQPRIASTSSTGKSSDQLVAELAASLESELPPPLSREEAIAGLFERTEGGQLNSLSVVLGQEMDRFTRLDAVLRQSLAELQKALKGLVVMSAELEKVYNSMLVSQVPELWAHAAYPSLKPLASWVSDYKERIAFMRSWLAQGPPSCFWLPGFFFPQGFMTGVLQLHARKYSIPIDSLSFGFKVTQRESPSDVTDVPEDGVLIHGLWLEGARWDRQHQYLLESELGVMVAPLPIIHFSPELHFEPSSDHYQCPLYKTSVRAGVLSTTGQSTVYVLSVSLPCRPCSNADRWVLQGVALLCMTNE